MNTQLKKKLKEKISDFAYNEGLSDVRFTDPKVDFAEFNHFKEFIQKGYHGQMDWLNNNISWRRNQKDRKSKLLTSSQPCALPI